MQPIRLTTGETSFELWHTTDSARTAAVGVCTLNLARALPRA